MNKVQRLADTLTVSVPDSPYFAFDTETHLITPDNQTPPLVCVSVASSDNGKLVSDLFNKEAGLACMKIALDQAARGELVIVGQNIFYDFGILASNDWDYFIPRIFAALDKGAVYDTWLAEQMLDIAWGNHRIGIDEESGEVSGGFEYTLESLAKRHIGLQLDKDTWRLRYAELDGVALNDWPDEAILYPLHDARSTYLVMLGQQERATLLPGVLTDLAAQCRAYWALHLCSVWGVNVDQLAARTLNDSLEQEMADLLPELFDLGFLKAMKKKGELTASRDMKTIKNAVYKAFGGKPPMSNPSARFPDGQVKTDAETLQDCNDPNLMKLWDYAHKQKMRGFVDKLDPVVHPRYGLAASGRTTAYKPNIQQLPRAAGMREVFVPPDGCVFSSTDYATLELCTWAQVQLWVTGHSALATAINNGEDPHLSLAAYMLHISYDEAKARKKEPEIKDARQLCKVPNFGYPGGMGWRKLVQFARASYGMRITEDDSKRLKAIWMGLWNPKEYFNWVAGRVEGPGGGQVTQFVSGRIRGGVGYTDACNTFFQGLAADGAKAALYRVVREMCVDERSVIYGDRVHAFVHDELVCSHERDAAHDGAHRVQVLMEETMKEYVPDVKIKAEPCLMNRWSKGAEPAFQDGRLVPWQPKEQQL